jgi:hypothetical protein
MSEEHIENGKAEGLGKALDDTSGPYRNGKWVNTGYVPSKGRPGGGKVCGAKRLSDGQPCQRRPSANGKCPKHGGHCLAGIASPSYKHGRLSKYTKYLPAKMQGAYQESLNDPQLTSLMDSLALIETRVGQMLQALDKKNAPPWGSLIQATAAYEDCKTPGAKKIAWRKIVDMVEAGEQVAFQTEAIWKEIKSLLAVKANITFVEAKARKDLQTMIPLDQVMAIYQAILEALKLNITDTTLLRAVTRDILSLMPPPSERIAMEVDAEVEEEDIPAPLGTK